MTDKKFKLSSKNKFIGGVCGGIAEYLEIDPILIRITAALLTFLTSFTIVLYLIMWFTAPTDGDDGTEYNGRNVI